ncbi:MAG: DUF4091 domain-containing protein [Myxococcaceae bacterium]
MVGTLLAAGVLAWAGTASTLVKVRPGSIPALAPSARLSLARGECGGVQLVAKPPAAGVGARLEGFRGLEARLYREDFVEVRTPSNGQGASGAWPDPLVPVQDGYANELRRALPADSTEARPLVLYLELCAPLSLSPGAHGGAVRLSARGLPAQRVPVAVRVRRFEVPATSSLPTSFGISLYSIARGHRLEPVSPEARALLQDYGKALLAHRLSAHGMGMEAPPVRFEGSRAVVDFSGYDAELAPFLEGSALPSGARFTTTDLRDSPQAVSEEEKVRYYRAVREHHQSRGWPARLFFYAKDEPAPADFPLVLRQSARVRGAGGVKVLVTAPQDERLDGAADILCPNLNCFFPRPGAQTCRNPQPVAALRAKLPPGTQVWWYQSCSSHGCGHGPMEDPAAEQAYSGWASYMVDHPAPSNRAMGALAYSEGIDGELYFDTVHAFNQGDPWEGVFEFGGNGDGTLFYPGTPARVGGERHVPIESLRLKQLRDGLVDYEYLRLLERLGDRPLARASARRLVRSGYEINPDPAEWESVRQVVGARIDALWRRTE